VKVGLVRSCYYEPDETDELQKLPLRGFGVLSQEDISTQQVLNHKNHCFHSCFSKQAEKRISKYTMQYRMHSMCSNSDQ